MTQTELFTLIDAYKAARANQAAAETAANAADVALREASSKLDDARASLSLALVPLDGAGVVYNGEFIAGNHGSVIMRPIAPTYPEVS